MKKRSGGWAAFAMITGVIGAGLLLWISRPSWPPPRPQPSPVDPGAGSGGAPPVPPLPPATTTPLLADGPQSTARRAESPRTTEAALMATLRPLVEAAPRRAVDMAREGQRRFGATNDAPERDWIIVKALVNLGELHAARDEARRMVETYPDSQWTQDVRRHLLVYPLDQPSREEMQRRDAAEP